MDPAELDRDPPPREPGGAFGDTDQQQRQPAEQDVGPDPRFEVMMNRAEFQRRLEVAEAAFGFEEVLVAQGDVLGGQVGVGGAE